MQLNLENQGRGGMEEGRRGGRGRSGGGKGDGGGEAEGVRNHFH